jgi:flagellar assembly protein FliH
LETTLSELDGLRHRIRRDLEREVVELALHVARKVIHHELSVSGESVLCVVKEAMGHLDDPGRISVRLNPADLQRIRGADERLQAVLENHENIHFDEDPGIDRGGCYIHTAYGEIDARIEEQLRHIEEAFRAEMRHSLTEDE